jgi:iron complex outermembrane receptor protein
LHHLRSANFSRAVVRSYNSVRKASICFVLAVCAGPIQGAFAQEPESQAGQRSKQENAPSPIKQSNQTAFQFSIPAQDADDALTELAKQANTTLLFPFDLAQTVKTNSLEGNFTLNEALSKLLDGTELAVVTDSAGQVSIRSRSDVVAQNRKDEGEESVQEEDTSNALERIAVVGTRSSPRSVVESPVPLDIIGSESLRSQGNSDALSMLSTMVPSLNVNDQPINDATSLVRPANLRGMASDHTLLLVNGKRRHRSAVITFLGGGLSDGAQGPDISVIPAYALKQIEVLRDGAAAQYGSDAIAGVINFVLDDSDSGGSIALKTGTYSEGDGELFQIQANKGFRLGENGFLNATVEYRQQQGTSRSVQRDDAQGLIDAGNRLISSPAQIWGALDVNEDMKMSANAGWDIAPNYEGYALATYAHREISGGFYFRNPQTREGVFSETNEETGESRLLVGDLDGIGQGIRCPTIFLDDTNVLDNPDYLRIADNTTALGANCFAFNEWFPGGFTPQFGGTITDASVFAGVKTELDNGWAMDLSASVGYSDIAYRLSGTVNPSLGPDSPLSFSPGSVSQVERTFNLDFAKLIQSVFEEPISIAMGAEWRRETYFQKAGDDASYAADSLAFDPTTGASQGFSIGSNGFPGYQPQSAGHWSRSNWAVYIDLEFFLSEAWQFGVATRVEHFTDFGSTFDGKLSTRYKVNDLFALRGSINTGFKAPTVGQSNVINVTTAYSANGLEDQATLPPTDLISQQLGATPLTPEESVNFSLGVVMHVSDTFFATLDYFNIRLMDRISTTSAIPLSEADIQVLSANGRDDAANYNAAKFFTNDFDTQTQGVDLVVHYDFMVQDWKQTLLLAYNWTDTQVERVTLYPTMVDGEITLMPNLTTQRIRMLEDNLPAHRGSLTLEQYIGDFNFTWRATYYGKYYEDHLDASAGMDIYGSDTLTADAQVAWFFSPSWGVTLGVQNLFDTKPDSNPFSGEVGALYPPTSPGGINGAFYYLGLEYSVD